MSSPGIRSNKPAAGQGGKNESQQSLRVLLKDGTARAAVPSIAMPRAKTELSELLASDDFLCARRRVPSTATRQSAAAKPLVESPDVLSAQQNSEQDSLPQARTLDGGLGQVIDAWPGLPRNVRAAILAMIRETSSDDA